jgi:hypothetical protein
VVSPNMRRIRRIQMRNHSPPHTTTARHNSICCGHLQPTAPDGRSARLRKIRNLIIFPENHALVRNNASPPCFMSKVDAARRVKQDSVPLLARQQCSLSFDVGPWTLDVEP